MEGSPSYEKRSLVTSILVVNPGSMTDGTPQSERTRGNSGTLRVPRDTKVNRHVSLSAEGLHDDQRSELGEKTPAEAWR